MLYLHTLSYKPFNINTVMKKIIYYVFALLVLNSCSTYYYMSFNSPEKQSATSEFESLTFEKENIKVNYSFQDLNGRVNIEVFNNSDEAVYVDWSRSSFIVDSVSNSLQSSNATFQGQINTTIYQNRTFPMVETSGSIGGSIQIPTSSTFVPPHTKINYNPIYISQVYQLNVPKSSYRKNTVNGYNAKTIVFDENDSPLKLSAYLTIVKDKEKKSIEFKNPFYISSIIKTGQTPNEVKNIYNPSNNSYFKKTSSAGSVVGVVGVLGLLGVGAAFGGDDAGATSN